MLTTRRTVLGVLASSLLGSVLKGQQLADNLRLQHPKTGIRLRLASDATLPMLKVLLPQQPETDRGIAIEFPEHAWGRLRNTKEVRRFFLITSRRPEHQAQPTWHRDLNALVYEMDFQAGVRLSAKAEMEPDGIRMTYVLRNNTDADYEEAQAPTCVKLYSDFYDLFLERTYVHHKEGFDLLASETPERLKLKKEEWLPCRYLVPFTLPVVPIERRIEKMEDGITWYHKRRQVDAPFIATLSHDGRWTAATHTVKAVNIWTNPERTCHHADPSTALPPHGTGTLSLKLYLVRGPLDQVWRNIRRARKEGHP